MDSQKRIQIPKEFRESNNLGEQINFYYSPEEKLFFAIPGEIDPDKFFIASRKIHKGRIFIPDRIIETYEKPKEVIITMKNGRLYLLPIM